MPNFGRKQNTIINEYNDIKKYVKNGVLKVPDIFEKIGDWAFSDCNKIKKVVIGKNINTIGSYAFSGCKSLKEVELPSSIEFVGQYCFVDCKHIEKFITPINNRLRVVNVFANNVEKMNWVYKVKNDDRFVFSFSKPTAEENVEMIINLHDFANVFKYKHIGSVCDDLFNAEKFEDIIKVVNGLKKYNIDVHYGFIDDITGNYRFNLFANADFGYFKNEFESILKDVDKMMCIDKDDFYRFVMAFGCFSDKKIVDNTGKETEVLLSHKACSLLSSLIKKGHLTFDDISLIGDCDFINYPNPSQEFLKFISEQGPNKTYPNLALLLKLERKCPGLFAHLMTEYDKAKSKRNYIDSNGYTHKRSWEDTLITFYKNNKYINITDENRNIAERFAELGVDQETFDKANEQYEIAKRKRIPHNILNKEIKETTLDEIEKIKQETKKELAEGQKLVENLYDKQFTFEMLDKYDPDNAIIGLLCSCCAHVTSDLYGGDIARATVIAPDVQNIVVRDNKGKIIAKGAMYVNQKYGYAVINDFEINDKFRKDEVLSEGRYNNDDYTIDKLASNQRKMIFDTFIRGIKAFVKEYDIEHPSCPIKKVNVGWGYNRLKKLCEQYEKETERLHVPVAYNFVDSTEDQYILYEKGRNTMIRNYSLEKKI